MCNSIVSTIKHITHDIQTHLGAELISIIHQLGMTDFIKDLDQYLKELASTKTIAEEAATTSKNSTLSTSSSPLTQEEHDALTYTKIWWTGSNHGIPLTYDYLCYNETYFQCRKLRHIHINCYLLRLVLGKGQA